MAETSLRSKATKGVFWGTIDKIFMTGGQLIIGIILARILTPHDFGLVGMLSIFIAVSQTFIDSGMGSGLIQKTDRSDIDFSTVFVFNFLISLLFYLILFFSAPLIATFYETPRLEGIVRILPLCIVIDSLTIVQQTKLKIAIDFKIIAKANVFSVFISGVCAIFLAYTGWGVWALVIQRLIRSIMTTILIWFLVKWRLSLAFSWKSFKNLFGFGSKLLLTGIYAQTFNNVYNIVIGKAYSAEQLGFYTRAKTFAELTSGTVSSILHQVTYPILASLQNDKERMVSVYSRLIRMTSFFVLPTMTMLAFFSDPLIRLLLTDKWAPAIVLLQWMSFARIFYPISVINMNILNAVGRSDLFLKVDLSKSPIVILALIITIPLGIKAIVIGHVITSFISFFINAYMPGKMFGYGAIKQLKDMIPIFIATAIMGVILIGFNLVTSNHWIKLTIGPLIGLLIYLSICYFFKLEELKEIKSILLKYKRH